MRSNAAIQPAAKESPAGLRDILTVNSSLMTLLTEEAEWMDKMDLPKVASLQERKLKLTGMLERYMRHMSQHPEVLNAASEQEKAELKVVAAEFQRVMKRNYDTLLVARAVNKTVVKCVTQVVTRREQNPIYNAFGLTKRTAHRQLPISITINETA